MRRQLVACVQLCALALACFACLACPACAVRPDAVSNGREAHDQLDGGGSDACCAEQRPAHVIEVLFAQNQHGAPDPGCSRPMCQRLTEAIRGAQHSVDFAIYGIRNQNAVIDALVEAQVRGVRVRGVVDTEGEACDKFAYLDSGLLWQRLSEGSVTCDSGRGYSYIMHDKFFVIDEALVWTGSTNISDTELGGEYYADVAVLVHAPELAQAYGRELEEMFGGAHHTDKKDDTTHHFGPFDDGSQLECYFSPSDHALENAVLPLIDSATDTLDISMFFFTESHIAKALLAAQARGVRVRMVLDAGGAQNKYSKHSQLCAAGVPVKVENWGGKAHNKWAVADQASVLVGSLNWTVAANEKNDENTLLIHSPGVAAQFEQEFERQWRDLPDSLVCASVEVESAHSSDCVAGDCAHQCRSGACCDGLDNDYDGRIDLQDEACGCNDGLDNDSDGFVDGADFDCQIDPEG